MAISLRDDRLTADATVLIHMGAGVGETIVRQLLGSYQDYRPLAATLRRARYGLFAVSVYGLVNGVTRDEVFRAMPHAQFGEARYGDVQQAFPDILATVIDDANHSPEMAALQRGHFDVVLPHPNMPMLATSDPRDLVQAIRDPLERQLRSILEEDFLPLFRPRTRKNR